MNAAALGGGSGELRAYYSTEGRAITGGPQARHWVTPDRPVTTPWVTLPGMLTAECKSQGNITWLEVTVHASPSGARVNDITGDVMSAGQVNAQWGLHTGRCQSRHRKPGRDCRQAGGGGVRGGSSLRAALFSLRRNASTRVSFAR